MKSFYYENDMFSDNKVYCMKTKDLHLMQFIVFIWQHNKFGVAQNARVKCLASVFFVCWVSIGVKFENEN